jgi:transposase
MEKKDFLSEQEEEVLKEMHRTLREKRIADRIKAVLCLNKGFSMQQTAELLLLDDETIRRASQTYKNEGLDGLLETRYHGYQGKLSPEQEEQVKEYIKTHLVKSAKEVVVYMQQEFGIEYTPEGTVPLLHRLGFVYKKTKLVPSKADKEAQEEFLVAYQEIKKGLGEKDKLYFLDGVHPVHNAMPAHAWIEKGKDKELPSNTGRKRININGALDVENLEVVVHEDPSINSTSTVRLLEELEEKNPEAEKVVVIADNARYYRSKEVFEYLEGSKIEMVFLPPYSPNLNLIERLWKYFKKEVLRGKYYETFALFRSEVFKFFAQLDKHTSNLRSLLTENFHLVGT